MWSQRLNILCISFIHNNIVCAAIWEVDILLTWGKHLHDRIVSLSGEVWVYKTSLIPPLFIEVPVPSERPCICALSVSNFDFQVFMLLYQLIKICKAYAVFSYKRLSMCKRSYIQTSSMKNVGVLIHIMYCDVIQF